MNQAGAPQPHARLDHLDSVRGIAALIVVAHHFVLGFGMPGAPRVVSENFVLLPDPPALVRVFTDTPLRLFWDGKAAVSLFFVLSGFVLSYRYFRTTPTPDLSNLSFTRYAAARWCRIWIPYMVVCAVSALAWRWGLHEVASSPASDWLTRDWNSPSTGVLAQLLDIRVTAHKWLVNPAWSLTLELCISLLVPLGVLVAARFPAMLLPCALCCCVLGVSSIYVFHFALGIMLAKYWSPCLDAFQRSKRLRLIAVGGGFLLVSCSGILPRMRVLHLQNVDTYAQAIGSALLMVAATGSSAAKRFLSTRVVHHIGRVSYSIYLVHMLLLLCLTPRLMAALAGWPAGAVWAVGLAFTLLCSIAVGTVCYYAFEVPSMALGIRVKASRPIHTPAPVATA